MNALTKIAPTVEQNVVEQNVETPGRSLLRFMTCGSVDDGKSTLIGRMLYDADVVADDQLAVLERDSKKFGTTGGALDFALLVDGLSAEREQGITIDVAFRYFATARRPFIVADTPGHEQYTRNMATGASNVELAIILIDASKGILPQTRRHSFLVSMMQVRHVVLAINKMDLVEFSQERFDTIVQDYQTMARDLGFLTVAPIPICAREGDNIATHSPRTPWFQGASLLDYLETVDVTAPTRAASFHLPVQWVNRPDFTFRGYAGTVESGAIDVGDTMRVTPGGQQTTVARIVTADGDLPTAVAGQAITLTLADEIDVSRGSVLATPDAAVKATQSLSARILWMRHDALAPQGQYRIVLGTAEATATVEAITHAIDIHRFDRTPLNPNTARLEANQIGDCRLRLDRSLAALPYERSRTLGGFILIDRLTNETVALGVLQDFVAVAAADDKPIVAPIVTPAASSAASAVFSAPAGPRVMRAVNPDPISVFAWNLAISVGAVKIMGGSWAMAVGAAVIECVAKALLKDRL